MDSESTKEANGGCVNNNKPVAVASLDGVKVEEGHANGEDDSDSNSLLPPRRGGMSRKSENKTRSRKVQWNDKNGNKLVEVLEYEPR